MAGDTGRGIDTDNDARRGVGIGRQVLGRILDHQRRGFGSCNFDTDRAFVAGKAHQLDFGRPWDRRIARRAPKRSRIARGRSRRAAWITVAARTKSRRWWLRRGRALRIRGQLALQLRILCRNRIDRRLAISAHGLVLGLERGHLLFEFGARDRCVLQLLLLARHGIEAIAIDGDEFALRQIAIDDAGRIDGFALVRLAAGAIGSEHVPGSTGEQHGANPADGNTLAARRAGVERCQQVGVERLVSTGARGLGHFLRCISHGWFLPPGPRCRPWLRRPVRAPDWR